MATKDKTDLTMEILKLRSMGISYKDIGGKFGITLNSVSGIIYRAKKKGIKVPPASYSRKIPVKGVKARIIECVGPPDWTPFIELHPRGCRYTLDAKLFCNVLCDKGSYCTEHRSVVYDKTRRSKRK